MRTLATILILFVCTSAQSTSKSEEARFDAYVMQNAHQIGITVSQVFRLWDVESGRLRDATPDGKKGECGRAQIMLSTARDYDPTITKARLRLKWENTRIMFAHLRSLRRRLQEAGVDNDLLPVLMFTAWNTGIGYVLAKLDAGKKASTSYGRHVAWGSLYHPPKHWRAK